MTIWDEETEKARLYRDKWDAQVAFRADQLRALTGSAEAFSELWDRYMPVYSPFNYIEGEEQVEFFTPFDVPDRDLSGSPIRLPNTTHAGDGMRRRRG